MEGNNNKNSARTWCFTLNNYTEDDINLIKVWECNRILVSKEVGTEGTPHLQGAITWKRTYRLAALKKMHTRIHWEVAKTRDCFNYCAKEGSEIIVNENYVQQGQRTDLSMACDLIKEAGLKRVREECPEVFVKYHNGLAKLAHHHAKKQKTAPEVYWYWGLTGTGKTRTVVEKEADLWITSDELKWFDGYEGQDAVVFDDFRSDMCKFRWLLRLLDRYDLQVPVKGSFVWWCPKRIYITSCKHPRDVYSENVFDKDEKVDQLLRRIKEIRHFTNRIEPDNTAIEIDDDAVIPYTLERVPGVAEGMVLTSPPAMSVDLTFEDFGF